MALHRFSTRLPARLTPNRIALALERKRREGCQLFDLTASNPTLAGIAYPEEEILAAFHDPAILRYEPSPAGLPGAREAVRRSCALRGLEIDVDSIVLTSGTSEAYSFLFKLLADPGDAILVPRPSYPLFDLLAGLEGLETIGWPLRWSEEAGWRMDLDALERAISPRTRAVVVVHPDNPTGSFLKTDEVDALVALCRERNLAILSDEVFHEYAFGPDPRRASSLAAVEGVPVFALGGLSKTAGLPQIKLSWILLGGPAEGRRETLDRLEVIADTWLSVSTPAQVAAPRLLAAAPAVASAIRARCAANLAALKRAATGAAACRLLEPEGGWYALLRIATDRDEEAIVLDLIERDGVVVQPGWFYDFEEDGWLVVSLLPPEEEFREGLARLLARLAC